MQSPNTKITALPFQSAVDNIGLTVTAGFQPQLLLGVSVLGHDATAGLGVFFDLPKISATVEQVTHVNSKCDKVTNSNTANGIANDIYNSLTHVYGGVEFDIGLLAQANLNVGGHTFNENGSWPVLSTAFPLPTACISFDSKAKTYGAAGTTAGAPTGTGSAGQAGHQKSGAALTLCSPIQKVAAGLLILVSMCFIAL